MSEECQYTQEEKKKYCLCDTCRFTKQCFEDMERIINEIEQKNDITNQQVEDNAGRTE